MLLWEKALPERLIGHGRCEARRINLDPSAAIIPEEKFGYLLENPSNAGVFRDSMGFDHVSLEAALRRHLSDNWERAESLLNPYAGTKIRATGPMTGSSGATWAITAVWNRDADETIRFITATP